MTKVFLAALAAVIVLSANGNTAFVAEAGSGRYFVEADSDRACNNAGGICTYADADGDGVCDVWGTNYAGCLTGDGTVFVDADGDGICDNYVAGQGAGNGQGNGARSGNYVDADGDGICDNYVAVQNRGNGRGRNARGSQGGRGRCGR